MIPIYLENLGIVNALGNTKASVCDNFLKNSQEGMFPYEGLISGKKTVVGSVHTSLVGLPDFLKKYHCRNNQLLATAYLQIEEEVSELKARYGKHRIGVILGTSTSGIASAEIAMAHYQKYNTFNESFDYKQQEIGSCSAFLSLYADITGVHYTVSTACSSSGKAIAEGARLIQAGFCDAVIAGGSDSLCGLTLNGFDSLELLSESICNPFSKNRRGLNIGEGAALFVLTKRKSHIKLSGIGEASDGYHIATPDPKGVGATLAIKQALQSANRTPNDIAYINLHGTATKKNDEMESYVVNTLFQKAPLCSSTKPLLGHTLGAAAAQELGLCWLLLSHYNPTQLLPKHLWDSEADLTLPPINLVTENAHFKNPIFMSNSFAFGGSNVSLIIEGEL